MASTPIITESDRGRRSGQRSAACLPAILLLAIALCPLSAHAHQPERRVARELVRLQGYRGVAPVGASVARELTLVARGREQPFFATDVRQFDVEPNAQPRPTVPLRSRLTLQADVPVLNRFANARPDQTITILGEQRPGGGDLFILTLDLCPPN